MLYALWSFLGLTLSCAFTLSFQTPPPSIQKWNASKVTHRDRLFGFDGSSLEEGPKRCTNLGLGTRSQSNNVFDKERRIVSLESQTDSGDGGGIGGHLPPDDGTGNARRPWRDDGDGTNDANWWSLVTECFLWSIVAPLIVKTNAAYAASSSSTPKTIPTKDVVPKGPSVFARLSQTLSRLNPFGGSRGMSDDEEEQMEKLRNTIVRKVVIKNGQSSVVPQEILTQYATRAGLIGANLTPGPVQDLARLLKQYYQREGYVLSGMTGATLIAPENEEGGADSNDETNAGEGIVEISVEEPIMASQDINGETPVAIAFAKKMVIDPNTGEPISLKDYKKKLSGTELANLNVNTLNTTYIQTTGRTRTSVVSRALGLEGGERFRWRDSDWPAIQSSDVFQEILQAEPVRLEDGTIQFRIICRERPVRNLEYGVSKSLFNNKWEGELGLEYGNAFGGGETFEVSVRRAATAGEAGSSYRVSYKDQDFCTQSNGKRGWSIEAFNECIGTGKRKRKIGETSYSQRKEEQISDDTLDNASDLDLVEHKKEDPIDAKNERSIVAHHGEPSIRKGLSYSVNNPLRDWFQHSQTQLSAEQVLSDNGVGQNIISSFWSAGPFVAELPRNGRHSIDVSFGVGATLGTKDSMSTPERPPANSNVISAANAAISFPFQWKGGDQTAATNKSNLVSKLTENSLPYGHVTATTRQIVPLRPSQANSPVLALKHSVSTCSSSIPHHRAVANAANVRVRGYSNSGSGISSIAYQTNVIATTEIRVPLDRKKSFKSPLMKTIFDDSSLVLFGEWLFAQKLDPSKENVERPLARQSSVGIGVRKTIQGIPIKYDVCLTKEGKLSAFVNFGRDFDVY